MRASYTTAPTARPQILRTALLLLWISSAATVSAADIVQLARQPAAEVRVLIELRQTPLLARRPAASSTTVSAQSLSKVASELERAGARIDQRFSRVFAGFSARVRRSDLEAIRKHPAVARVRETRTVHASLAESVPATGADKVWSEYGTRGEGRVVAIIDTGIDWHHPAFGGALGPGHRVAGGWDFINNDPDPDDDNGHGTHVAGIVAADGGGLTGVAPHATLLAYKVLDNQGSGDSSLVIAALERAVDPDGDGNPADHADVINMSLGAPGPSDDPLVTAVENAVSAGCVVVIAAGNAGSFYSVELPGLAPSAITVGATDRQQALAAFSSRGPVHDSLLPKPEILAPGVGIVSAKMGGGSVANSGTSMAAPHIAGIAALLRSVHPQWTPAQVKSALVSTAIPLESLIAAEGAGRVDALAAAHASAFTSPTIVSFGRTSGLPRIYSASVPVSFTNESDQPKLLELESVTGEQNGIDVTAPDTILLAAGETRAVALRLDVDNEQVPAPTRGSLTFGGAITFRAADGAVRVPWMLVKAGTLTIDWQSDEEFDGILLGESVLQRVFGSGPGPRAVFVPAAEYDLTLLSTSAEGEPALLTFEKIVTAGDPVLVASPLAAEHTITVERVDESGAPLRADEHVQCTQHIGFRYPSGRATKAVTAEYDTPVAHINDVRTTPLIVLSACSDPDRHAAYTIDHAPALPIDQDVTLRNDPAQFLAAPIRIAVPSNLPGAFATLIAGMVARDAGGSGIHSDQFATSPAPESFWRGTLFLATPVDSMLSGIVLTGLRAPGKNALEGPLVRREGERIVTYTGLTPAPNDVTFAAGETIAYGAGPIYPVSVTQALKQSDFFFSFHQWTGMLGEYYRQEVVKGQYELYDDATGALLRVSSDLCCQGLAPGAYRVVGHASLPFEGRIQRSTVITTFDTRRADSMPPAMNRMRIVDAGGRVTNQVRNGGALLFSVEDFEPDPVDEQHSLAKAIPADKVAVSWRHHGSAQWVAATPVVVADDQGTDEELGHQPTGLHFRVDLSGAARSPGELDVRISFADDAGNTTEWIGESAARTGESRVRSVRK